ncbi:Inner membrane protein YohC [Saliniradius amylolyticus]|uniref:Inner membrane protein YohC n=1 Tax=Saliniradius amylolyticus TaxID=2183582 RepID=A0A2S2E433_9ALTE|nr:Yip1 family protein [Saliniradius amylolyticus]AWL12416.1 Inner membrane protein YohC [Saliniradius amylolyticus]
MILNHLWGLYAHPKEEWHTIDKRHEGIGYSLVHVLIMALIPTLMGYYSAAHIGWSIGVGDPIRLTTDSAMVMGGAMYVALVAGVFALAYLIQWMAGTFDAKPTFTQSFELAVYTATPLFMVGFAAFYPELWFMMLVGLAGLSYSVYLLYSGVPILMHIPEEKGFIYSSSVVTCGLVLLVVLMAATVILWSYGLGPQYVSA